MTIDQMAVDKMTIGQITNRMGSQKLIGDNLKFSCLGQVSNKKLGCFEDLHALKCVDAQSVRHTHLKLKTRPRFCPVGESLYKIIKSPLIPGADPLKKSIFTEGNS